MCTRVWQSGKTQIYWPPSASFRAFEGNQPESSICKSNRRVPQDVAARRPDTRCRRGGKVRDLPSSEKFRAPVAAVILTSTDLQEVLGICDRIIVMQNGRQAHLLENNGMTSADLLSYFYATSEAVI